MRFLLDTNICILAMRGDVDVVASMAQHRPDDVAISTITSYELFTGIEKCAQPTREKVKVDNFLKVVAQLTFDSAAARKAGYIRALLEAHGNSIGPYDILIAGHANSLALTLVTTNTTEFSRIPKLPLANWQETSR